MVDARLARADVCRRHPRAGAATRRATLFSPVGASRWQLGVRVRNLVGGVQIIRVLPGSVAAQSGLEVNDTILGVNGAPVGIVGGRLHDLEDELNRQADIYGRVALTFLDGSLQPRASRQSPELRSRFPGFRGKIVTQLLFFRSARCTLVQMCWPSCKTICG